MLVILYPLACLIIPFVVAAVKKCFIPALWTAVINALLFLGMHSSYTHGMDSYVVIGALLMGAATLIAIVITVKKSSPLRDPNAPQRTRTASAPNLSAGEQVIFTRVCLHIVPLFLWVNGVLASIVGLGFALDKDEDVAVPLIVIGLAAVAIAYFLDKLLAITLTVTNKRVIVNSAFNSRKSLPINRISAVGTAIFSTLYVGSSAGRIILPFVPGCADVYDTINALLGQVE